MFGGFKTYRGAGGALLHFPGLRNTSDRAFSFCLIPLHPNRTHFMQKYLLLDPSIASAQHAARGGLGTSHVATALAPRPLPLRCETYGPHTAQARHSSPRHPLPPFVPVHSPLPPQVNRMGAPRPLPAASLGASRRCPLCRSRCVLRRRLPLHISLPPGTARRAAPAAALQRAPMVAPCWQAGGSPRACTPAGQLRAAGSPARGRGSRRLAAAVRVRSCGRRAGWPAGQAGPGAGSKEALRGDGCRPRAADSGQGEASSRRDRSRASPPACGSASRTSWFEARERDNGSAADRCTRPRTRRAVRPGVLPSRCSMAQAGQGGQGSVRDRGAPGRAHRLHMPSHRPRGGRIVLVCPI